MTTPPLGHRRPWPQYRHDRGPTQAEIAEYLAVLNADDPQLHRAWLDDEPARTARYLQRIDALPAEPDADLAIAEWGLEQLAAAHTTYAATGDVTVLNNDYFATAIRHLARVDNARLTVTLTTTRPIDQVVTEHRNVDDGLDDQLRLLVQRAHGLGLTVTVSIDKHPDQ